MMKDLEQSCSSANLGRDGIEQVSKSLEVVSMSTDALVSHVLFPQKTRCVGQLGRWIFGIPYAMLFSVVPSLIMLSMFSLRCY